MRPSLALLFIHRGHWFISSPAERADVLPGSRSVRSFPGDRDLYLVENPPDLSVHEVLRRYRANPNVLYAEPDYVVNAVDITPGDPLWGQQWDMATIAAPTAWDRPYSQTDASDVIVAIIDTGIDFTHEDLRANVWTNPNDGAHGYTGMNGTCVIGGTGDFGHGRTRNAGWRCGPRDSRRDRLPPCRHFARHYDDKVAPARIGASPFCRRELFSSGSRRDAPRTSARIRGAAASARLIGACTCRHHWCRLDVNLLGRRAINRQCLQGVQRRFRSG